MAINCVLRFGITLPFYFKSVNELGKKFVRFILCHFIGTT